jgi:hypothetical protein
MKNQLIKRFLDTTVFITLLAAISQSASASYTIPTVAAPDAGSTSALMFIACGGLAAVARRFKR